MTPIERLTGRKWSQAVAEFGEIVLAKLALSKVSCGKRGAQKNKLAARFIKTVWVGQVARTGEHVVIKKNGDAMRCRTIRRVPIEDRWSAEEVLNIRGSPRCPAPSRIDSDTLQARRVDEEAVGLRAEQRRRDHR